MTTIVTPNNGCMHDDIEIIPVTGSVRCTVCGYWWHDAYADVPLNPDNEPTSEHNQWREKDDN